MRTTIALALAGSALLLTGCGSATPQVAQELTAPTPQEAPHWPTEGCEEHSMGIFDFAFPAPGSSTPEEAAAAYLEDGDELVREEPQGPHHRRGWMVVTPDNEIRAILDMWHEGDGYVVDGVEACAG